MKKVFFVLVAVIIAVGVYLFVNTQQDNKVFKSGELTARSLEYIKTQKAQQNQQWRFTNADQPTTTVNNNASESIANDCFSIKIPFRVVDEREENQCSFYFQLADPTANLTAYEREVSYSSLNDDPGVFMRRQSPRVYKESTITANDKQFLVFQNLEKGYEKTVFYLQGTKLFILNLEVRDQLDKADGKLKQILESIEFL